MVAQTIILTIVIGIYLVPVVAVIVYQAGKWFIRHCFPLRKNNSRNNSNNENKTSRSTDNAGESNGSSSSSKRGKEVERERANDNGDLRRNISVSSLCENKRGEEEVKAKEEKKDEKVEKKELHQVELQEELHDAEEEEELHVRRASEEATTPLLPPPIVAPTTFRRPQTENNLVANWRRSKAIQKEEQSEESSAPSLSASTSSTLGVRKAYSEWKLPTKGNGSEKKNEKTLLRQGGEKKAATPIKNVEKERKERFLSAKSRKETRKEEEEEEESTSSVSIADQVLERRKRLYGH